MSTQIALPGELLNKWDELRRAIGDIQTAQPSRMTAASEKLEAAKNAFERALQDAALAR